MSKRNIIVIGASAGGSEAITELCSYLPPDIPASVFIAWHLGKESSGYLPNIISKKSSLPAKNAEDGEEFKKGNIYVAPPDKHLLLIDGSIRTARGPKENRFRPAIDPLFRSAAYTHGTNVIGIILTGMLNDGTAGLWAIKDRGGVTIVQDPNEAQFPGMPQEAIKNLEVDHIATLREISELIIKLSSEEVIFEKSPVSKELSFEIEAASGKSNEIEKMNEFGELSGYTCPECHGALWKLNNQKPLRFRCHTGHAYTAEYLLEHLEDTIDQYLWNLRRGIEENIKLLEQLENIISDGSQTKLEYKARIMRAIKKVEALNSINI
jgi:two-component system, chemotaxis family, protein-glutamate methylesterase/glutaminase